MRRERGAVEAVLSIRASFLGRETSVPGQPCMRGDSSGGRGRATRVVSLDADLPHPPGLL